MALPRRSGSIFAIGPGSQAAATVPECWMLLALPPAAKTSRPPCRTQSSMPWSVAGSSPETARPQTMIESAPSKSSADRPNSAAAPPALPASAAKSIATTRGRVPSSRASSREARSAAGRSPSTSSTVSLEGIGAATARRARAVGSQATAAVPAGTSSTSTRAVGRPNRTVRRARRRASAPAVTTAAGDLTYCPSGSSTHTHTASGAADSVENSTTSGVQDPVR